MPIAGILHDSVESGRTISIVSGVSRAIIGQHHFFTLTAALVSILFYFRGSSRHGRNPIRLANTKEASPSRTARSTRDGRRPKCQRPHLSDTNFSSFLTFAWYGSARELPTSPSRFCPRHAESLGHGSFSARATRLHVSVFSVGCPVCRFAWLVRFPSEKALSGRPQTFGRRGHLRRNRNRHRIISRREQSPFCRGLRLDGRSDVDTDGEFGEGSSVRSPSLDSRKSAMF